VMRNLGLIRGIFEEPKQICGKEVFFLGARTFLSSSITSSEARHLENM